MRRGNTEAEGTNRVIVETIRNTRDFRAIRMTIGRRRVLLDQTPREREKVCV